MRPQLEYKHALKAIETKDNENTLKAGKKKSTYGVHVYFNSKN